MRRISGTWLGISIALTAIIFFITLHSTFGLILSIVFPLLAGVVIYLIGSKLAKPNVILQEQKPRVFGEILFGLGYVFVPIAALLFRVFYCLSTGWGESCSSLPGLLLPPILLAIFGVLILYLVHLRVRK